MEERNIALRRALYRALFAIGVIVAATALILVFREGLNPFRAGLTVVLLLAGISVFDVGEAHVESQAVVTMVIYARILITAIVVASSMDFILRTRLPMLFPRRSKRMKDHVILCGLGQVGFRVLAELGRFDVPVTVIDSNAGGPFVPQLTELGIPALFEDARNAEVLMKAGLETARPLIACTDDDLTNVEIALDARDVRPDIRVVLRLFDERLAAKIQRGFDIQLAFSASSLAAPAFAAAAVDQSVKDSFYVGDRLYVHSRFFVPATSSLADISVWDLWGTYSVNTISFTDAGGEEHWDPSPATKVPEQVTISMVGPYERIKDLQVEHGIIESSEVVAHRAPTTGDSSFMPPSTYIDPGR